MLLVILGLWWISLRMAPRILYNKVCHKFMESSHKCSHSSRVLFVYLSKYLHLLVVCALFSVADVLGLKHGYKCGHILKEQMWIHYLWRILLKHNYPVPACFHKIFSFWSIFLLWLLASIQKLFASSCMRDDEQFFKYTETLSGSMTGAISELWYIHMQNFKKIK